jgi:hypothetical protein
MEKTIKRPGEGMSETPGTNKKGVMSHNAPHLYAERKSQRIFTVSPEYLHGL